MLIVGDDLIAAISNGVFHLEPLERVVTGTQKFLTSPATIVAAYIIQKLGKMTDPSDRGSWPLYISHLPEGRNVQSNCGAVYDTAGTVDLRSMTGQFYQHPGVQFRIRSSSYEIGYVKIEDIANALDAVSFDTVTIGSSQFRVQNISRTSPIAALGIEPGTVRRFHFTINFLLTVRKLN